MATKLRAGFIEPMLLKRTDALPRGEDWAYELKLDGYRAIAFKTGGRLHLRSRNDNDFMLRYPAVVDGLRKLQDETVIDGEVVAFDEEGRPSFNVLQNYGSSPAPVVYYVFDLLILEGRERDLQPSAADIRALLDEGLVEARTIVINHAPERVLVLSRSGQDVLEAHRQPGTPGEAQRYYSGLVKPRELAHDAQLYRLFETERRQLEDGGGRITRVVLDYELKRDYHAYVHRQRSAGVEPEEARGAFARDRDLPLSNGRIELPDVRIEYETVDGLAAYRDLELATEHYSRSQLSGKQAAGFRVYRAAGARGGTAGRRGGTPSDPHLLEWLR